MFNFGSDDKKELEQNMQEIKGMIQGDENRQSDSGFNDFDGFDQGPSGDNQSPQQGLDQRGGQNFSGNSQDSAQPQNSQNQGMSQQPSQDLDSEDSQQDFAETDNSQTGNLQTNQGQGQTETDDFDPFAPDENEQKESQVGQKVKVPGQSNTGPANIGPSNQQGSGPENSEVVNPDEGESNSSSERSSKSISRNTRSSKRKPQKTDSTVDSRPSADEPLFLKEENFVDVREMIEEMGYLAQELQENLDEMKKTVHKEKEYAKDAQEVVNAYSDRRGDIEDIIRTGQK